ncbi:MAG: ribosome small subunit-dependent GTPase A, partial [Desulfitobacteriaceae bacterium]
EEVRTCLKDKISVLAGQSGVGKSSLINALSPGLELKTNEVSRKISRGRHTTRHVELMLCAGGLVADTPGFSALTLPELKREDLSSYFPEFIPYLGRCRFKSCLHHKEPDCAIKEAIQNGAILPFRYEHYLIFLQEVIISERSY